MNQLKSLESSSIIASLDSSSIAKNIGELVELRAFNSAKDISSLDKMYKLFEGQISELKGEAGESQGAIEQNVYIDANFPGVSVEEEIISAFDTLFTKATQQMYNTKK
jgi:hypothetical protein